MFNIPKYMDRMIGGFLFGFLGVEGFARDEKKKLKPLLGFNVGVRNNEEWLPEDLSGCFCVSWWEIAHKEEKTGSDNSDNLIQKAFNDNRLTKTFSFHAYPTKLCWPRTEKSNLTLILLRCYSENRCWSSEADLKSGCARLYLVLIKEAISAD